jgi:hypothetical protein
LLLIRVAKVAAPARLSCVRCASPCRVRVTSSQQDRLFGTERSRTEDGDRTETETETGTGRDGP